MYKLFDWYVDVWIMTESSIVDMKWKWFSSDTLYIPYGKVEGIEIRTRSWWAALLGMSDVVVKLAGDDSFTLYSAKRPTAVVGYLQAVGKKKKWHESDDKEPFDILVDTLSWVVKWHLTTHGKDYITREYVKKLDETVTTGIPIDLRTEEEKILIENWKDTYETYEDTHAEHEEDEHRNPHH